MTIVLDISRLLSRTRLKTPTGIDRVELAYALAAPGVAAGEQLGFAAVVPWSTDLALLPRRLVMIFLAALAQVWTEDRSSPRVRATAWLAGSMLLLVTAIGGWRPAWLAQARGQRPIYLVVSHHHLDRARLMQRIARRFRIVCLIHDLIPIEFPEYVRPGRADQHGRRMKTVAALADGLIFNSAATADAYRRYLAAPSDHAAETIAWLGVDSVKPRMPLPATAAEPLFPAGRPYFVAVGTIEPRKNHLLLLNLWRGMVAEWGDACPGLVIIGKRGWENENVVDMLERTRGFRGIVLERSGLGDCSVQVLLGGCRAALLPSFAEGYGLPLVEALVAGVPTLCSDLPVLREIGGDVPEFLDPTDGPAWRRAILEYARPDSDARAAQLDRLARWVPPSWQTHFTQVEALLWSVRERDRSYQEP